MQALASTGAVSDNWPDTGVCPTRKGADRSQVSRRGERGETTEPPGKLDAMTTVMANGPAGADLGFAAVDSVCRMRQGILARLA